MSSYQGLGRGLGSLIPTAVSTSATSDATGSKKEVLEISLDKITANPRQPRSKIDRHDLEDLMNSIKVHGILQPLLVTPVRNGYQLIAGERRFQAAKYLGLKTVPVIARPSEEVEKLELALIENIQREDLNAVDRARAYSQLIEEFSLTQDEVAKKIGQSRSQVANTLRFLHLPDDIKQAIMDGRISEGHAKALLGLPTPAEQLKYFQRVVAGKLTVRDTEQQVRQVTVRTHRRSLGGDPQVAEYEAKLAGVLGTKVKITKRKGRGAIRIEFYSDEELRALINKLTS